MFLVYGKLVIDSKKVLNSVTYRIKSSVSGGNNFSFNAGNLYLYISHDSLFLFEMALRNSKYCLGGNIMLPKDLEDLDFVAAQADSIGYSFVKSAADMAQLQQELRKRLGRQYRKKAIIAKIETKEAVHHLPDIIVQAASRQPLGIMIARGDLAVEVGYQRLAELQEEILWICESAHVPVIWATQVLENLVRTGLPSRAEITDAAMGERAECVMLNKGPYIVEGVAVLNNILQRMESHQYKKSPELRALSLASEEFKRLEPAARGRKRSRRAPVKK